MRLELCRARSDERRQVLPGDSLIPQPAGIITHAITIDAPPDAVWPWVVQLGSGRAGWYAYDHIDNGGVPSVRRIVPELQYVAVGDVLPSLPGARDSFIVADVLPERALVLEVPLSDGRQRATWALVLAAVDGTRTRLVSRGRISHDWLAADANTPTAGSRPIFIERVYGLLAKLPWPLLLPVAGAGHYLMESRMLRGVKHRAEQSWREVRAAVTPAERKTVRQ